MGRTFSTRNEVGIYLLFFTNFFTGRKTIKFYCVLQPAVMLSMLWGCLCTSDILGPNYYFKKPRNSSNSRHQKGYFQLLLSYLELSCVSSYRKVSWWEYLQFIYSITNYKKNYQWFLYVGQYVFWLKNCWVRVAYWFWGRGDISIEDVTVWVG